MKVGVTWPSRQWLIAQKVEATRRAATIMLILSALKWYSASGPSGKQSSQRQAANAKLNQRLVVADLRTRAVPSRAGGEFPCAVGKPGFASRRSAIAQAPDRNCRRNGVDFPSGIMTGVLQDMDVEAGERGATARACVGIVLLALQDVDFLR